MSSVANFVFFRSLSYREYPRYDQIIQHLKSLEERNPNLVKLTFPGSSVEGRKIPLLHIGPKSDLQGESMFHTCRFNNRTNDTGMYLDRHAVFIDAGIHAREWIAPISALYAIDAILDGINTGSPVNDVDWFFFPILNPDGYEFSHESDRNWRKNRRENSASACAGVDLNRNFDVIGNGVGASTNPCKEIYKGV